MKICVDLSFYVPIWRFFYGGHEKYKIPYEFIYKDKKYTNSISIIQIGHFLNDDAFKNINFMNENDINQNVRNYVILMPTLQALNLFKKYRPTLNCCLINQNAFIDESLYKIDYTTEKKFDLIVNSSFTKLKNYDLIKNIKNSCAIGYFMDYENHSDNRSQQQMPGENIYCPNFDNQPRTKENCKWLDPLKICNYYNMSKIGGIFSIAEGVCFSSGEYLLCGMPVLSCKCEGGREIWYNNENSVLCEPTEESVISNLNLMLDKYNKGEYDREKIRNDHIKQMDFHRNNLTNEVLKLMKMITLDIPEFEALKNSLKYYHSNCQEFVDYININYENQTFKEYQAINILGL